MKKLFILFSLLFSVSIYAQVGIGTTSPHSSSVLDISSTTKGFLLPRLTGFQRGHINSPSKGLMIYCSNCCSNGVLSTFNGTTWINTPSCLNEDPDADGILAIDDLDEDNDGILDVVECPFRFADFDGLGDFFPGEANEVFNTDITGAPLPTTVTLTPPVRTGGNSSHTKIYTASSNGNQIGLRYELNGGSVLTGAKMESQIGFSTPNTIRIVVSYALFPSLGSQININDQFRFTPINAPSDFEWIVSSTNNATVNFEGNTIVLGGTSTSGTSNYAEFDIYTNQVVDGVDVSLTHVNGNGGGNSSIFAFSFGCVDSDSDGTPDYLDLDSDNDGTPDANEAGYSTSTNPKFQFTNPTGSNGLFDSLEVVPDASPVVYK